MQDFPGRISYNGENLRERNSIKEISTIIILKNIDNKGILNARQGCNRAFVKGFELDVIDYLMKPVSFERFRKAIDKAVEYLSVQVSAEDTTEKPDYLFIKTDTRIVNFLNSEVQAI